MGTTLTGTTPQDTYDSLIKVTDNGPLTGSLKVLTDGLGNDSALALSTGAASITGTLTTSSITRAERLQVGTAASLNTPAGTGNTLQFANYSPSAFVTGSADSYIYKNSGVFGGLAAQSLVFQTRSDVTGGGFAFVAGGTPAVVATITGTGILNLAQGQIKFPATQVPSADANTLDDYEEGIWTPTISFGGASTGVTYSAGTTGQYTKIGRQVTVTAYILLTSKGSSTGDARIGGLPFTIANATGYYPAGSLGALLDITYGGQIQSYGEIGSTTYRLNDYSEAGAQGNITDADFSNSSQIIFTATYYA